MDNKFSWLQLSDLHIFENSTDWSLMKQSFEALSKAVHPDFLVFTGDYRHLGYNKSYDSSLRFINDIVQLFGLTKEDVFFVPGNHDVQTYDYRNDFISCIKSSTEDVELYKKFMQHDRADLRNAFSEYDKFIHSFYGAEVSDDRVQKPADVVCIPWKNRINIILVNSALASTGKRDCKEIIDISSLSSLRIDNGLPTIALMHHDINSIAKPYQDRLSKIVEMLKISAILCGDKHKLDRIGISQYNIPNTTVPVIVCGKSSVEPRDRYSDLSVIEYNYKSDGNVYVQVYRYNNKADSFGFVKSGDFYHNVNMPFYFPMRPTKNSPTSAQHSHANGANDNKPLDNSSVQQKTKKKKSNKRKPRSIWLPDAELASGKQTRFDSYTETKCIAPFLEPDSRFLGVSSVKGIGKTFVLQVKRVKSSKKYLCLPQCSTPSIDNNWATERITFQSYDQIQTKNPYDDLVLLWMNAIRCYVVNNIRDETEAITKVIEDRSKEKRISKEIERFMLSDENRSLGNLVSNIITEPQWNNLLKQYDSAIKSICNRSLAIQRKNNPRSKDIAVFVDKVDQSILQTNAEPPADCVVCPKKDNYSECRSERKDPTYCSAENGCQSKNCCYGCELFASTKANAGLRIYDESNSARIKHVNIWQYLQLALMHAAAFISDETQGRIKVFYTMREEVFNCEGNRLGEQNNKIAGRTQKLKYSINEQEKIFNECIQEQADEYLFDPSYKNTPGKQAYAFVGISKLCHPYCKTKDGTNDSETLFESIFRHSFDRSRDIQRFGEYLTERIDEIRNCPTEHKREEFVKQAIEDLAANLAYCGKQSESTVNPSYYTEKMRYLPNYWADNINFENLLSLIDRNLLFEDDMRCICQKINNVSSCPNVGCKNDICKRHPFTVLFKLGYLGYVLRNPNNEYYERQVFLDAGEISYFAEADDLMSASHVAYIIHPALSKSIQRKYNKTFLHFSGFILGKDRPVETEKVKAMLEDRAALSKTEFVEKYYYNPSPNRIKDSAADGANSREKNHNKKGLNIVAEKRDIAGINRDLFYWAKDSKLYKKAVANEDPQLSLLGKALGRNETNRYVASEKLMRAVWKSHPELGLMPDYKLLSILEHNGAFYVKYRDHMTHMFKVFLLGLYLYENQNKLHEIIEENWTEDEFLSVWILAALWHDTGYLVENEDGTRNGDAAQKMIERLNSSLSLPLTRLYPDAFAQGTEGGYQTKNRHKKLLIPSTISTMSELEKKLDHLRGFGRTVDLSLESDNNPIQSYYNYMALSRQPRSYYDHGILSSCIMLHIRDSLCTYIEECKSVEMFNNQTEKIDAFLSHEKSYQRCTNTAAVAVALHNIRKPVNAVDSRELNDRGVTIGQFCIPLKKEPIAYLLRLCDELQCWDRQRFDAPKDYSIDGDKLVFENTYDSITLKVYDKKVCDDIESSLDGYLSPPIQEVLSLSYSEKE